MVRGWILLSCLALSVLFKLFDRIGKSDWPVVTFPFSRETLNIESWVYYVMEHVISIGVAACLLIRDSTPNWLLWLFFWIMVADAVHYVLFYRDTGIGFNLIKVVIFGLPLIWTQLKYLSK